MTDRELALELCKLMGIDNIENYFYCLEYIRKKQSDTLKGKLEELFEDYDRQLGYSDFARINFIDNVRKILKENK